MLLDAKHLHLQNVTRQKFFKKMLEIAKITGILSLYRMLNSMLSFCFAVRRKALTQQNRKVKPNVWLNIKMARITKYTTRLVKEEAHNYNIGSRVESPLAVVKIAQIIYEGIDREQITIFMLDRKNKVIGYAM